MYKRLLKVKALYHITGFPIQDVVKRGSFGYQITCAETTPLSLQPKFVVPAGEIRLCIGKHIEQRTYGEKIEHTDDF